MPNTIEPPYEVPEVALGRLNEGIDLLKAMQLVDSIEDADRTRVGGVILTESPTALQQPVDGTRMLYA